MAASFLWGCCLQFVVTLAKGEETRNKGKKKQQGPLEARLLQAKIKNQKRSKDKDEGEKAARWVSGGGFCFWRSVTGVRQIINLLAAPFGGLVHSAEIG